MDLLPPSHCGCNCVHLDCVYIGVLGPQVKRGPQGSGGAGRGAGGQVGHAADHPHPWKTLQAYTASAGLHCPCRTLPPSVTPVPLPLLQLLWPPPHLWPSLAEASICCLGAWCHTALVFTPADLSPTQAQPHCSSACCPALQATCSCPLKSHSSFTHHTSLWGLCSPPRCLSALQVLLVAPAM